MAKILKILIIICCVLNVSTYADTKTLRIPLHSSAVSLDPASAQDISSLLVSRQINCQLIRNQEGVLFFEAAQSVKYLAPFKIQVQIDQSRHFSDGSLITPEDIVASFNYIKNSRSSLRNVFQWIKHIDIVDKKTIVLMLKKPIPQILTVLSAPNYSIFKKSFLEKAYKKQSIWSQPIGCGNYKIADYTKNYIHLLPINHGLPIVFYLNDSNQIKADDMYKYDIVSLQVVGNASKLKNFNTLELFDPSQIYIGLNSTKSPWKKNENRCSFLSNLNVMSIVKEYAGSAQLARHFLPSGILGYDPKKIFMSDIDKKYTNRPIPKMKNFCLAYLVGSVPEQFREKYLTMVRNMYPVIQMFPIAQAKSFGTIFRRRDCDAIIFSFKSNYFDGYEYLDQFISNDINASGFKNLVLISDIKKSQDIIDPEARSNEYQEIINKIAPLCLMRPLITVPNRKIYVRNTLKAPKIGEGSFNEYDLGVVQ